MPKKGNTWIVGKDDNVNSIAQKVYGKQNERMFAQIVRLNGGVKTLQPGMVLKLPQLQDNKDIYISNEWAAGMGMATAPELQNFYASNPFGTSATTAARQGLFDYAGLPNAPISMGGQGLSGNVVIPGASGNASKPSPFKPFVNSNAASPFHTPAGMQSNYQSPYTSPSESGITRPGGNGLSQPASAFSQERGWNGTPAQPLVSTPQKPNVFQQIGGMLAGQGPQSNLITNPAGNVPPAQYPAMNNPQPAQPKTGAIYDQSQLPAVTGAGANPQQAPVKGQAGSQKGSYATAPITPQNTWGLTPNFPLVPTVLNQDEMTVAVVAPYIQTAMEHLGYSLKAASGFGNLTKTEADLLEAAGIIVKGDPEYEKMQQIVSGGPGVGGGTGTGSNVPDTTGSWDPYDMGGTRMPQQARPNEPLSQWEIDKRKIALGRGEQAANAQDATTLQKVLGTGNNLGPLMGLMQWRTNF